MKYFVKNNLTALDLTYGSSEKSADSNFSGGRSDFQHSKMIVFSIKNYKNEYKMHSRAHFHQVRLFLFHSLPPMQSVSFSKCVGGISQRGFFPLSFFLFLNILLD